MKEYSREPEQCSHLSLSLLMLSPEHLINICFFLPPFQTRAPFSFTWTPSWLSSSHSCPLLFISILTRVSFLNLSEWLGNSYLKSFNCVPLLFGYNLKSLTLPRAPFLQTRHLLPAQLLHSASSYSLSPNHTFLPPSPLHPVLGKIQAGKAPYSPAPLPTYLIYVVSLCWKVTYSREIFPDFFPKAPSYVRSLCLHSNHTPNTQCHFVSV